MELVDRMLEVQTTEQGIGRDLCRAQDVAAAVRLDLGERKQLAHTPIEIPPHPSMHRQEQAIERRHFCKRSHMDSSRSR